MDGILSLAVHHRFVRVLGSGCGREVHDVSDAYTVLPKFGQNRASRNSFLCLKLTQLIPHRVVRTSPPAQSSEQSTSFEYVINAVIQ
jgi:hypothetical protein